MFAKFAYLKKKQYLCSENVIFIAVNMAKNVIFHSE